MWESHLVHPSYAEVESRSWKAVFFFDIMVRSQKRHGLVKHFDVNSMKQLENLSFMSMVNSTQCDSTFVCTFLPLSRH